MRNRKLHVIWKHLLQIRAQSYTIVVGQTLSKTILVLLIPPNPTFLLLSEGIHLSYERDCWVNILFPVRNDYG
jgi:hypothetical protein